jgi:protein-tyrosine-phosphatase
MNVLFLCTGNSARSIMAEALLNHAGAGRFKAFSAGSHPKGSVHPRSLATLKANGVPISELRSKAWDEFARPGAPPLDIVVTVCDQAAGEVCPIWPGGPMRVHWGIADPAAATGSEAEQRRAFETAFAALRRRIDALLSLPLDQIDRASLAIRLREIGQIDTRSSVA